MSRLTSFVPICDAIAMLLPGQIEVILHDLGTERIAHISCGLSNRQVGDPSMIETDLLRGIGSKDVIGPYGKKNWDGASLKSISAVIRDDNGDPYALLCINFAVAEVEGMIEFLSALARRGTAVDARPLIEGDWREHANAIIASVLDERKVSLQSAKRDDRAEILRSMDREGILQIRGATDYLAQALGISRASLYAALKAARNVDEAENESI